MIKITLVFDNQGCIKTLQANGHSELAKKSTHKNSKAWWCSKKNKTGDILCAAVSIILQTTANLISANQNIQSEYSKNKPGELNLKLFAFNRADRDWLKGITDFCRQSLGDLKNEYPEEIVLHYFIE